VMSRKITQGFVHIAFFLFLWDGDGAFAATQSMSATLSFAEKVSLSNLIDADMGVLLAQTSGVYTLSPQGGLTASEGGVALGGDVNAGSVTISGSNEQAITVQATNYTASNGVVPSDATCSYDGGAASACAMNGLAPPGAGKTLLVGVTITVDGTQAPQTTAAPSFDLVVNYL